MRGLWSRQLDSYPANGRRWLLLAIAVLSTIVLYYELYVQSSVATQIIAQYNMSFRYFVLVLIAGNALGAIASLAAGLADRWGRANIVAYGLVLTAALVLFGMPNAGSKQMYLVMYALVSIVEGALLVATPALIRDFSPQLGRATAMGFWTLGPVLGSLLVTEISSHTLTAHPDWQFQFQICGVIGLAVFVIALIGLRELSPRLRDQLMVSLRDKALVEARAADIDTEAAVRHHWRQMLRLDVVGSAFGVSLMLLFYYSAVAFFVVYFVTTFNYTTQRANDLGNWYWITNAIALIVTGLLSDLLKVRKPFMVLGGIIGAAGVALFAINATSASTSYDTFVWIIMLIAGGGGIAYCAWMAAFTETVERHNPAATATGLAVWGWILRMVVTVSFVGLTFVVSDANKLVNDGPRAQALAARYSEQLTTLQSVDSATLAKLSLNPADSAAGVQAVSEISGVPSATVAKLAQYQAVYPQQIATLQTVDVGTLLKLRSSPTDAAALRKAAGELVAKFGGTQQDALARIQALQEAPPAALASIVSSGPAVADAQAKLIAASGIPKTDIAFLRGVQSAQGESPKQWQQWWWICFAGQLLFLPLVFLLKGRWNPAKARADAEEHRRAVDEEMKSLGIPAA